MNKNVSIEMLKGIPRDEMAEALLLPRAPPAAPGHGLGYWQTKHRMQNSRVGGLGLPILEPLSRLVGLGPGHPWHLPEGGPMQ